MREYDYFTLVSHATLLSLSAALDIDVVRGGRVSALEWPPTREREKEREILFGIKGDTPSTTTTTTFARVFFFVSSSFFLLSFKILRFFYPKP